MKSSKLREQIFDLLYAQGRPEQAVLRLNRILKTAPEHSEALALRAYALNKLANSLHEWKYTQHAFDSSERALAFNPDDEIALISKGWALIDLGRAKDALSPLQHATKVNPANEYAWYNLAWAQYLTGNAVASKESIERTLQLNPGNPIIKQGKEMMEKGQIPDHLRKKQ